MVHILFPEVSSVSRYNSSDNELRRLLSEDDIDKGMITLLNKGIIPKDVDLTPAFEKGAAPVTVKSMKFHEK